MIRASMKSITLQMAIAPLIIGMLMLASAHGLAQDQDDAACTAAGKNPEAGIEACTRLLEREIRDTARRQAIALSNRAWAWKSKGELGRAVSDLTDAISADPSFVNAYAVRGDVYRTRGQCDKAVADYDQVIRLLPERAATYIARGVCRISKQDYDRALADYEQVAKLDPDNAQGVGALGWSMKGRVRAMKGDLEGALVDFDEAIRLDPQRAAFYNDRGAAWSEKRDYEHALADYDQAIKLDSDNAKGVAALAWSLKAMLHSSKGDADQAIADFDQAIRLDPQRASFHVGRGNLLIGKGDRERAMADYDQALKLDPKSVSAYKARGNVYQSQGEYTRATQDYDQAISLRADDPGAYGARATARFYLGDFARAADDFAHLAQGQNVYPMLWLYISRARSGSSDAKNELAANAERRSQRDWPYPIVELYLGRRSPDATVSAAVGPDQQCEARFYIGEWYLLQHAQKDATDALQSAANQCRKYVVEFRAATVELSRLNR